MQYKSSTGSGKITNCGPVYQTDPENETGRFIAQFGMWNFNHNFPYNIDYLVLDTDYENYAAVLGCEKSFGPTAAVLTREEHPDSLYVSFQNHTRRFSL